MLEGHGVVSSGDVEGGCDDRGRQGVSLEIVTNAEEKIEN